MNHKSEERLKLRAYNQEMEGMESARYVNIKDISIPSGYNMEVFAQGLDTPISMQFADDGSLYIAESGITSKNPKVLKLMNGRLEIIADGFNKGISGISFLKEDIYVSHKGTISVIKPDGSRTDILSGLPSGGDYTNSKVVFDSDNKMYFGQGTVTNSGVVGLDNVWLSDHPFLHDYQGGYIMLQGQNFETKNFFIEGDETVYTGAFSSYGVSNLPYEVRKGLLKVSGSILRANLDGSKLELVAWGLRNPCYIKFDESQRLFAANRGFDVRGSRPIANASDEFYLIEPGEWYGWPDFSGGEPITLTRFKPQEAEQPEFLLFNHPGEPPKPFALFPPHSSISGFDFNYNSNFGPYGDVYIAEYGSLGPSTVGRKAPYAGVGHRISKIDMNTGGVTTFAINQSGFSASVSHEGGFSRLVDLIFGPDGAMYVLDAGMYDINVPDSYQPNTGVIWRITKI